MFFQNIPHPTISLAKLELFTREVATTVTTRISHILQNKTHAVEKINCFVCVNLLFFRKYWVCLRKRMFLGKVMVLLRRY
jgi:hypothetical protein